MSESHTIRLTVNGRRWEVSVPPMTRLIDVLRETCGLVGTKNCCSEGDCGACTVLIDGSAVVSCLIPIIQAHETEVRTIEGLAEGERLNELQQAFLECGGTQCGACVAGFLMAGYSHMETDGSADDSAVRTALSGVLCRCTGYNRIVHSVQHAMEGDR